MSWLTRSIKWIMLVSGLLTCTMFYAALAPQASLRSNFGAVLEGPLAEIVVRNWGALIGIVGLLMVYGALHAAARRVALLVAVASKMVFIGLVMSYGRAFLGAGAVIPVVADSVMVLLFALYLLTTPRAATA